MNFIADEPLMAAEEKRLAPLYQLPNSGDWITLADIKRISTFEGSCEYKPGVIVVTRRPVLFGSPVGEGESWHRIECGTIEDARELRDKIAVARNKL